MPLLWDKKLGKIVSNDSWSLVKMLCTSFAPLAATPRPLYPPELAPQIDARHAAIWKQLLNGVYMCGISLLKGAEEDRAQAEVRTPRPPHLLATSPPPAPHPAASAPQPPLVPLSRSVCYRRWASRRPWTSLRRR